MNLYPGKQGQDKEGGKTGIEQEISSPWDIIRLSESAAAIAMAGRTLYLHITKIVRVLMCLFLSLLVINE